MRLRKTIRWCLVLSVLCFALSDSTHVTETEKTRKHETPDTKHSTRAAGGSIHPSLTDEPSGTEGGIMSWIRRKLLLLALAVLPAWTSGCNPFTLGFLTPIPVQPWTAERLEQKLNHKNDGRTPIMP